MYIFIYIFSCEEYTVVSRNAHWDIKTIKVVFKFIFEKTRYQLFIGEESDSDREDLKDLT